VEKLDRYDVRILCELQRDSSLTNTELAERVGLSPPPCWRRVRKLEEQGVVQNYVALLDAAMVGYPESVFVEVKFSDHNPVSTARFEKVIQDQPEILECYATSGSSDYLLKIAITGISSYHEFLSSRLMALEGVSHFDTRFVLKTIKYTTALPVSQSPGNAPSL